MRDLFEILFITSLLLLCWAKAPADPLWVDTYRQAVKGEVYGKPHKCVWFAETAEKHWRKAGAPGRGYQVTLACTGTRNPEVVRKRHRIFVVDDGDTRWCVSNEDAYEISPAENLAEAWDFSYFGTGGFGSCWDVVRMRRCAQVPLSKIAADLAAGRD